MTGARIQVAPLTREQAAVVVQRLFRGHRARMRVRKERQSNAAVGLAVFLASGIGQLARRLVDDVLLAPVNLASEQLIHRTLGKLLDVLVVGGAAGLIKITTSGIVLGGSGGLRFDDEALAAMLGGRSPYRRVWISQVVINIPVLLTVYPIAIKVKRLELQMTPDPIELSAARLAELRAALSGSQSRGAPRKQPSGEQRAREAARKVVRTPNARGAPLVAAGADEDEDRSDSGSYGSLERARDGVALTIDIVKITQVLRTARATTFELAVPSAAAAAAELRLRSCGPFVCGLRRSSPTASRTCAPQLRALLRALGVHGADRDDGPDSELAPAGSTIVLLEGCRLVNANSSFVPLGRLAMHETRDKGPRDASIVAIERALAGAIGGVATVFGSLRAQIGGLFAAARAKPSPSPRPPPAPPGPPSPPARASPPVREVKVHMYKRLEIRSLSASSADGTHGSRPFVEGFELAVHAHLVRAKRTGKLVKLDVELILPGHPIAYHMPVAPDEADQTKRSELQGELRVRMDSSPLTALASSAAMPRYFYSQQLSATESARAGSNVLFQLGEGILGGVTSVVGMPIKVVRGGAKRIARTVRGIGVTSSPL
jgi:hypothetical protein